MPHRKAASLAAAPAEPAPRVRTFLKGVVLYDNRRVSIDCTIRDLSHSGARLVFATMVAIPDQFELQIPQKGQVMQARVRRREGLEIGVSFEDQRSGVPRRVADGELAERVEKLEAELASMKRLVQRLKDKVLPSDADK